ncbi:hypothetical protein RUM44_012785 [Polyplax serrata]|uniref:1-acyl-sn-glycerol-3-phosphate acyltransferase n=1 Tax=Polyplax serrata TaxID=468196 RepID=A0ABR1BG20_POLSC
MNQPYPITLSSHVVKNKRYAADFLKRLGGLLGIKWEERDMQNMLEGGAIVIANHQSSLDLLGMFQIWRVMGKVTAIAKKELFYIWPFGFCAWLAGVVFIDRTNASKSYNVLKETAKLTQRDETKLFFFPEGTRNAKVNNTKQLLPFKKGAFRLAISTQVPILPVVFSPYYFINSERRHFGQGKVIIKALPAIPTTNLTDSDVEDLMKRAYNAMQSVFHELCAEITATLPDDHYMRKVEETENQSGNVN